MNPIWPASSALAHEVRPISTCSGIGAQTVGTAVPSDAHAVPAGHERHVLSLPVLGWKVPAAHGEQSCCRML